RIYDLNSENSRTFKGNYQKQKRNNRWSVGDVARPEVNTTEDKPDQPLKIPQSVSNTSNIFFLEKLRTEQVEDIQENTSTDEADVTDIFLQVPGNVPSSK